MSNFLSNVKKQLAATQAKIAADSLAKIQSDKAAKIAADKAAEIAAKNKGANSLISTEPTPAAESTARSSTALPWGNAYISPLGKTKWDLMQSPEVQAWNAQGRLGTAGNMPLVDLQAYLTHLREQDKTISNNLKIATGKDATPEDIAKYSQFANDPALLESAIGKDASKAIATGTYNDKINALVQEKMGRPATQAELESFGKQMEAGNIDVYGLGEFLGGTTEYQTKESDTARGKLAGELGSVDTAYLNKIQSALESKYASMGRKGSSAFGSALIGAGKDLATERTGYLAGLGYQDFQRGQGNLTAAYQNRLSQMYANQQNQAALGSESRNRYYSQQDFSRQQAAQERLARLQQPKQGSFLQNLAPGLVQGGLGILGSYLGKPQTNNYYGGY